MMLRKSIITAIPANPVQKFIRCGLKGENVRITKKWGDYFLFLKIIIATTASTIKVAP